MDHEPKRRFDEYEVLLGLLLPALLLILIIVNITTRTAWGPTQEDSPVLFYTYTRGLIVCGFVLVKTGLAGGLFVWFWMANRPRLEKYIITLQAVSIGITALGVALLLVSLFF